MKILMTDALVTDSELCLTLIELLSDLVGSCVIWWDDLGMGTASLNFG